MKLYLDGYSPPLLPHMGVWAWVLSSADGAQYSSARHGVVMRSDTTSNQMVLQACIEGLAALPDGAEVEVICTQTYLVSNKNKYLEMWAQNRWHKNNGGLIRNVEQWQEIDRLARDRQCRFTHVREADADRHPWLVEAQNRALCAALFS